MLKNRLTTLIFRLFALLFAAAGTAAQTGLFAGGFSAGMLMYYTIQSNLLAIALFALLAVRGGRGDSSGRLARFEFVCVVDILVTFIVFWGLLAHYMSPGYLFTFANLAVHAVTPLLCLTDYVLFAERRRLKYRDVYLTCVFPLFYVLCSAAAGLAGYDYSHSGAGLSPVRAPYFFLDYYNIGAWVAVYTAGILAFILLLGHGLYYLDRKAGGK
jgi:hypothetical protein